MDVDKLGKDEGQSWVYKGSASCREYDSDNKPIKGSVTRTLISLSPGGSDLCRISTPSTRRRPRNCICSMAWRFYAINAMLST